MYVFYECSIVIGWFLTRNRRKDLAAPRLMALAAVHARHAPHCGDG